MEYYTGTVEISGLPVALMLHTDDDDGLAPALRRAREVLHELAAYHRRAEGHGLGLSFVEFIISGLDRRLLR